MRLKDSKFGNPHGLQQKSNHASASDIACLMNYAMKFDLIKEVTGKSSHTCTVMTWDHYPRKFFWENTNKLLNEYFKSAKTGITPSAGPCLVSHFECGPY